jgi:hypothetical protein
MSSIRRTFSAIGSGIMLYGPMAFTMPPKDPSWLAPLSESTTVRVLSAIPVRSRKATSRARCYSACSSIAA